MPSYAIFAHEKGQALVNEILRTKVVQEPGSDMDDAYKGSQVGTYRTFENAPMPGGMVIGSHHCGAFSSHVAYNI